MGNDISSLLSRYGRFYINGTLATIVLSLVGTFGGLFLGIFLAFGKSLNTKESPWYHKIWRSNKMDLQYLFYCNSGNTDDGSSNVI